MHPLSSLLKKLSILLRREKFSSELEEEINFHREQTEKEFLAAGMTPPSARQAARRRFGNGTRIKEMSHEIVGFRIETVLQDFRYACRQLRKNSGFAITAIVTLALGIGAATAVFSVAYGVLIDPFPYKDAHTLATPKICSPDIPFCYWNIYRPQQFLEIAQKTDIFNGITASTISDVTLLGGSEPQRLRGNYITANTFSVLGVQPILGRASTDDDIRANHEEVALLSYRYWQAHFGGSPSVIGQVLMLNEHPRTVIGIMPPRFLWRGGDVYLPIRMTNSDEIEGQRYFALVGRLKPGVTEAQAAAELQPIFNDFAKNEPHIFPQRMTLGIMPFDEMFRSALGKTLYLLLGSVFVLLLIACVNVSSLLLARAVKREHEFIVRASIGASRLRLLRSALTESLLIALCTLPVALSFAYAALNIMLRIIPPDTIPDEAVVTMNLPVMLASVGIAIFTALFFGLVPAWQSSNPRLGGTLSGIRMSGSHAQRRLLSGFVVAEVALSLTLLMLAGLMIRSLVTAERAPVSFSLDHTLVMRIPLGKDRYTAPEERIRLFREILDKVGSIPGVRAVTVDSGFPFTFGMGAHVQIGNQPTNLHANYTSLHLTTPEYLAISGRKILQGHFIDAREMSEQAHEVVVTENFARKYFPSGNALGQTVHLPDFNPDRTHPLKDTFFTVVGVINDIPPNPGYEEDVPHILMPYTVAPSMETLLISSSFSASELINPVRRIIYSIDKNQPVVDAMPLRHLLDMYGYAGPRFSLALFGTFAAAALALTLVGIYGVLSFVTSQRTQEIGIRIALGADRVQVMWMVLRQACLLALIGTGLGLPLAFLAGRFANSEIVHTPPYDPLALLAAICVLPLLAVAGTYLPARRAAYIDPAKALRAE